MAVPTVAGGSVAAELCKVLDSPEFSALIEDLEATRWTGRPGYRIRSQVGMVLVKHLYCIPFWSRTIALVREHDALRAAIGCTGTGEPDGVPSEDALRRFREKLMKRGDLLADGLDRILTSLKECYPEMGENIAIDGSYLPAYSNGQKYTFNKGRERSPEEFSDPDAEWGHRPATSTSGGGGGFGFKLHAAVDTATELPLAWHVTGALGREKPAAARLLDQVRKGGFKAHTCAMDKGYDAGYVYKEFEDRDCHPIIPLSMTEKQEKAGRHLPHECSHGVWVFKGADYKRGATKWRCPTGECEVSNRWVPASRLHTLVPRTTKRWKALYTDRWSIEREFGRLKDNFGLRPVRVRKIERVKLHADLAILARLASALARARLAA